MCVCVCVWVIDGLKTIALCAMPWRPSHKHTASAQQCIWASDNPPSLFPRTLAKPPFLCHHLFFLFSKLNYRSPLQVCSNCPHFSAFCRISTKGHIKPGVCNRENALWINECKMGFVRLLALQRGKQRSCDTVQCKHKMVVEIKRPGEELPVQGVTVIAPDTHRRSLWSA